MGLVMYIQSDLCTSNSKNINGSGYIASANDTDSVSAE